MMIWKLVAVLCGCLVVLPVVQADIPMIGPVTLDGRLDESAWQSSARYELVDIDSGAAPKQPTIVRLGRDAENLYVSFECMEPAPDQIKRQYTHAEERDNAIYTDDSVELFLDPRNAEAAAYFHIIVNASGILYDAVGSQTSFDSNTQVAVSVLSDRWIAEIALPFSDYGSVPKGAETWRLNLARTRYAGGTAEHSCLNAGEGGFAHPSRFIALTPAPLTDEEPPVQIESTGGGPKPEAIINVPAGTAAMPQVHIEWLGENDVRISEYKAVAPFRVQYQLTPEMTAMRITVTAGGDDAPVIYQNRYGISSGMQDVPRTARLPDEPLFEELIGEESRRPIPFNGIYWAFGMPVQSRAMYNFALQYGISYEADEFVAHIQRSGMAVLTNSVMIEQMLNEGLAEKHGVPLVVMPRVLNENIPSGLDFNLVVVPEVRALYLDEVRKIASHPSPLIKGVYLYDEIGEILDEGIIHAFQRHPNNLELQAIDRKVKGRYGRGKYGIPASTDDEDPLAWIAYRRWLNDELVLLFKEASQSARAIKPDLLIISDDPSAQQSKVYNFADWGEDTVDILTHQLFPRYSPYVDSFGFLTKRLADLTGQRDIWPCPHVEEYGLSLTPEETLAKLSAAVRAGATGWNYYLDDTTGARAGHKYLITDRYGAPERYQVEFSVLQLTADLNYLNHPEPDSALFTATDSLRAQPGPFVKRAPEFDMHLYSYLGPGVGTWFQFINETTLRQYRDLSRYRLISSVENQYIDHDTLQQLRGYVEQGGVLLLLNPFAFHQTPEGHSLDSARAAFTGVAEIAAGASATRIDYNGLALPVTNLPTHLLKLTNDARVLATFDSGHPAIIERRLGKGRVITLAVNSCRPRLAGDEAWLAFYRQIAAEAGVAVDRPVWNFRLPETLVQSPTPPGGLCLTNNAIFWKKFQPETPNHSAATFQYTLEPSPNLVADSPEGKLTDRPRAALGPSAYQLKSQWQDWAIAYDTAEPIAVHFTFDQPYPVTHVKLWVQEHWRGATVRVDGNEFAFPLDPIMNRVPADVREVTLALPDAVVGREVSVILDAVPADQAKLILSEVEVWADESHAGQN